MADKLLVRSYNVGCGDCFYVRIPDDNDDFHILIDCGSKEGASSGVMKRAIEHLESVVLPDDGNGKKRLDLVVVTHRHEDHIKGFDPKYFENIAIQNIWITAAMDKTHPQAQKSLTLHQYAFEHVQMLTDTKAKFSPELSDMLGLYSVSNKNATKTLTETFPANHGIEVDYVFAGQTSEDHNLDITDTIITVLAPEKDIDGYYLGKDLDKNLHGLTTSTEDFRKIASKEASDMPNNISESEFQVLQSRLLSNGLAFAVDDTKIQNNVSTVLLIEWKNRRLLFVGDAEWDHGYEEGRKNSSWNVMWKERKEHLLEPIDFLKVGHHGSHNATPWNREEDENHEVNQILNAILPLPGNGESPTAQCLVSTKRSQYDTIPDPELLVELGKRINNSVNYLDAFASEDSDFEPEVEIFNYTKLKEYAKEPSPREVGEKGWLDQPQPPRTDMESAGKGEKKMWNKIEFVDVELG